MKVKVENSPSLVNMRKTYILTQRYIGAASKCVRVRQNRIVVAAARNMLCVQASSTSGVVCGERVKRCARSGTLADFCTN